ncbi:MAG: TetR/AcrR family transcriptional regulator [Candidatus Binatia bacterium]
MAGRQQTKSPDETERHAPVEAVRRRKQAERSAVSEQRILRAAAKLIARQGYTGTTLAEIGTEAGYTAGLVSHRFGSKLGLLRSLVEHIRGRFYRDQLEQALGDATGLDALCSAVDTYLNELLVREERIRVLYVLMGEALGPVPELRPVFADLNQGFRALAERWIESGIAGGEVARAADPRVEAALFVGALRGVAMQWLTDPGCFDLDQARERLKNDLRRRLRKE